MVTNNLVQPRASRLPGAAHRVYNIWLWGFTSLSSLKVRPQASFFYKSITMPAFALTSFLLRCVEDENRAEQICNPQPD